MSGAAVASSRALAVLAAGASAFFALFAPATLLRYLAAVILLLLVASYLYSRIVPRFLSVERESRVVRGVRFQRTAMRFGVASRLPFSLPAVRIAETVGRLRAEQTVFRSLLPARGRVAVEVVFRPQERGEFPVGPIRLSGHDPFGLFEWERSFSAPASVVVYPAIYRIELVNDRGLPAGSIRSRSPFHEDLTRYRGVREYVAGDEPKRVNWRTSAKMGRLYTTEYDRTLFSPVRLVLNICREDYPERRRDYLIERAIETAASLVVSFAQLGQAVGFSVAAAEGGFESPVAERTGWAHATELLERLARLQAAGGHADLRPLVTGGQAGTRVLLVGPDLADEQVAVVVAARLRGMALEHVKIVSATAAERHRELASLLRVTTVEEAGHDILRG